MKGEVLTYERVIAAALGETRSKFALAEALALDIPPRRRGPTDEEESGTTILIAEARDRIFEAGGEPRAASTLAQYRKVALWVLYVNVQNFRWVPGFSFTAHLEACNAGISFEEFAANPKTSREIRQERGTPRLDAPISTWSPDQRRDAARELLRHPDVVADQSVAASVVEAVAKSPSLTVRAMNRAADLRPAPEPRTEKPDELGYCAALGVGAFARSTVRHHAERVNALVTWLRANRETLTDNSVAAVREDVEDLREASEMLRRYAGEIELALGGNGSDSWLRSVLNEV